jgi:hypothetical protein
MDREQIGTGRGQAFDTAEIGAGQVKEKQKAGRGQPGLVPNN